jgi:hypothetical protein
MDIQRGIRRHCAIIRELHAAIPRQGALKMPGEPSHFARQTGGDGVQVPVRELDEHGEAGGPLYQGGDLGILATLQQVDFPMSRGGVRLDLLLATASRDGSPDLRPPLAGGRVVDTEAKGTFGVNSLT